LFVIAKEDREKKENKCFLGPNSAKLKRAIDKVELG